MSFDSRPQLLNTQPMSSASYNIIDKSANCPSIVQSDVPYNYGLTTLQKEEASTSSSSGPASNAKELFSNMGRSISKTRKTLLRTRLIHVIYVLSLVVYTVIGGFSFQYLDGEYDDQRMATYNLRCRNVELTLVNRFIAANDSRHIVHDEFVPILAEYLRELGDCYHRLDQIHGSTSSLSIKFSKILDGHILQMKILDLTVSILTSTYIDSWHRRHAPPTLPNSDLINSLIYAFSVFTTIGYGNIACETAGCRYATVAYAVVGIPLFFAFVSDMSLLLSVW